MFLFHVPPSKLQSGFRKRTDNKIALCVFSDGCKEEGELSVVNESAMSYTEETGEEDQDDGALTLDDLKSDNTASSPYVTQHAGSTPKVYACCKHLMWLNDKKIKTEYTAKS